LLFRFEIGTIYKLLSSKSREYSRLHLGCGCGEVFATGAGKGRSTIGNRIYITKLFTRGRGAN